ncbi:hypothetical protein ACB092_09G167400 [Castanea dentata]
MQMVRSQCLRLLFAFYIIMENHWILCKFWSDLHERVDIVACLGGDGVILHASNLFRDVVPPVVSFNVGSLGFLTSHTFDDYKQDLIRCLNWNERLDQKTLL